jgi:hypothetical protein
VFVAHRRAKDTLVRLKNPAVVIPDLAVDDSGGALTVGGTRVEMHYVGRNHTDNSLVGPLQRVPPTERRAPLPLLAQRMAVVGLP